ncbi:MAG: serine/threonine-protein kinase, partial [Dehalococcoidia bacterium]
MPSERIQRRIDQLLDRAEAAIDATDWAQAKALCEEVLTLDAENGDAPTLQGVAERRLREESPAGAAATGATVSDAPVPQPPLPLPETFSNGRYHVASLLGEGGKKLVYRAHDTLLNRDVAFALIKTDGLDAAGRARVQREAQALGQLSAHPNIVSVFDLGEEQGQPFIVTELLAGGDLQRLIADAPDHKLPLPRLLAIADAIGKALAFAHGKGVIHRDLKPGNVWLAEDGTPKLGDFGLAMALGDARITRAGMMVGTALYMAPEQATGGEVTPKSDLYSFGCLLYELVTGRPPFVGDESVAIIGQHLSTSPVAPTWQRPDCPQALDALILRLLEKDPAKRPASAQVVVEALSGVRTPSQPKGTRFAANSGGATDRGSGENAAGDRPPSIGGQGASGARRANAAAGAGQASASPSGPNPVYRRSFVGREQELRQLELAFDAAVSGQGSLLMVVGEPGIGKTTLTEQLATYASLRGGRTLVGHCYEEGSLSLPYLPFVEALRTYVLSREPDQLRSELGTAAPEVARIVSEVRDRVQVEAVGGTGGAGEDRYRLLQGVCSFLRNAAQLQPLVLVLEDLHDAEHGTLDLLTFLARQLGETRLLVVGTYRDVEVDRNHPLSATLAELRRLGNFGRVLLRGLTADEVQRMLSAIAGQDVPWGLAEGVHRQTEGNPLFVQEVMRYLAEEGLIKREGGQWAAGDRPLLANIPEGLRDVIGKRLARLSPACNQILTLAAVIGRDFALQTLQMIAGVPDDALLGAVEEALKVAVLQDQSRPGSVRYRFAHAFFRQTLYEELITPRRLRIHQQVARALEVQYAGRLDEHAAELAEHFAQSSDPAELAKAVEYGELAARRARAVFAHSEAARLLEQALAVQEVADPDGKAQRQRLLQALGTTLLSAGEPLRAATEVAPAAFRLAEELDDRGQASRACQLALSALTNYGRVGTPRWREWSERADRYAEPGSVDRLYTDLALSYNWERWSAEARALRARALTQARQLNINETLFFIGWQTVNVASANEQEAAFQLMEELTARSYAGVRPVTLATALFLPSYVYFKRGDRQRGDALVREAVAIAERTRAAPLRTFAVTYELALAQLDGRLEEAAAAGEREQATMIEVGAGGIAESGSFLANCMRPLHYLGRADALRSVADRVGAGSETIVVSWRPLCFALAGRLPEARAALDQCTQRGLIGPDIGTLMEPALAGLLEAAVLLQDTDATAQLLPWFAPMAPYAIVRLVHLICPARLLGDAALLLGEREQARSYYRQALETAAMLPNRPELALARLAYGALLLDDGTVEAKAEAQGQLTTARDELAAMHMQPALEQAERLLAGMSAATAAQSAIGEQEPESDVIPSKAPVFISYSSDDKPRAEALATALEAAEIPVWLDRRSI